MDKILLMGNPLLYKRSVEVTEIDQSIKNIVTRLIDKMKASKGVGIAAPQIGINKRIIIFGFEDNSRYPNEQPIPISCLINPEIEPLSNQMEDGIEGCLSVPGLRAPISRHTEIKYKGLDHNGNQIEEIATGFKARIIQHEIDHLDGVLFPFRLNQIKDLYFENHKE
ncbi:peptide deformylase [Thiotrichales bacterium 19S11-10]|nr:peptide deformylase [Thiotrichales bacterium 19S11-10]